MGESPRKTRPRRREMGATLVLRIQPELKDILDRIAESQGIDLADLVRAALGDYVAGIQQLHIAALGDTFEPGMSLQLTPRGYRPFREVGNGWEEVEVAPNQLPHFVGRGAEHPVWGSGEEDR